MRVLRKERRQAAQAYGELAQGNTTDTALITSLLAEHDFGSLEEAALDLLPTLRGAFCLTFMDEHTLYAARDPQGVRPLVLGRLERGWVVASETAALDIVGASFVREVEPGEFITIDENGLRSQPLRGGQARRLRLRVRLPGPPGHLDRRALAVYESRVEMGRQLAREHAGRGRPGDAHARIRCSLRPSATPKQSGIPYGNGLVKNAYVGRTFIQPSQTIRQLGIRLKLNPLKSVVAGKRLIVIDDSIVRGNTQRALVRMLREAGAKEVHVRISSPPVKWPCFYGIDFASRAELIANGLSVDEIASSLGADSLGFISEEGMMAATEQPAENMCTACFTGKYPIELPSEERRGKSLFDSEEKGKGGPLAGKAAEVTVERAVPGQARARGGRLHRHPRRAPIPWRTKFDTAALPAVQAQAGSGASASVESVQEGQQPAPGMCNPGPDADLEAPADRGGLALPHNVNSRHH